MKVTSSLDLFESVSSLSSILWYTSSLTPWWRRSFEMRKHLLLYVSTITHFSESTSSKYLFPRTCVRSKLGIEVRFDLLGQLQPGLVLRVGIGVHQDRCRCMTCVALHRLEVTVRLQELVGGTGMPQAVEHDLFKLRALSYTGHGWTSWSWAFSR